MLTSEQVKNLLTEDQIIDIMCNDLGSDECLPDGQGHLQFTTICHGGDSHKLYYYPDSHMFYCYTHCGSLDLFEIVRRVKGFPEFFDAFKHVVNYFGLRDNGFKEDTKLTEDWDVFQRLDDISKDKTEPTERIFEENILDYYEPLLPAKWLEDHITPEAMVEYGIRVDVACEKAIIPHRNARGELIGIRGRAFNPIEAEKAKYAPVYLEKTLYNFPTGKYLYGLWKNIDAITKAKRAIIVEGEKSVLQSASYFQENSICVATCGSNISQEQIDLLLEIGVEEVIVAFDHDFTTGKGEEETLQYEQKLLKVVTPLLTYFKVYVVMDYENVLGYKDSPLDQGKEIFKQLLRKKIYVRPIKNGEIRRHL